MLCFYFILLKKMENNQFLTTEEVRHSEEEAPITAAFSIVLTIITFMGTIGNTLIVIVMRKFDRMSTSVYLSVLAVCDNILLIFGKIFKTFFMVHPFSKYAIQKFSTTRKQKKNIC